MVSKGVHVLLDAIGRFPPGAISVDLFGAFADYHGDDSYRRRLEPLASRMNVRLHGAIAHEQVPFALASIDVLVVPSIWPENSPFAIHEAFLAGVPVIASRTGGIPELVVDGRSGLLFEAGDPDDLSRALARLLEEPTLLATLRAGIEPPRPLEDDVRFARDLYQRHAMSVRSAARVNRMAAVVLNFRTPDQTFLAVSSLLASRRPVDDLIVVNNDERDDTHETLKNVSARITYVDTGGNLGFSGGMNVGIRRALAGGAHRVLLVNSDVIVPPDAVERLEAALDATADAGIAGPVILARSEPNRVASLGMSWAPVTGRMRHRGHGLRVAVNQPTAGGVVDGVSGCVMLVKREVFEAVGLLDEDYFFSFEDLDFCLRARRAGFATVLAGSSTVYHEGGRSLGAGSARRFYFAARNHLLLAQRTAPSAGRLASMGRICSIVLLNLAHAVRSRGGSPAERLVAVAHGTRDYMTGRFGSGL
jgi:GT2 family glycosyltransferase